MRVDVNDLSETLLNELKKYGLSVTTGVKKAVDTATDEFVKNTKADAPRGRRQKFYRSISSRTEKEYANSKTNLWYVKSPEYRLTHLLKNGHATVSGGRTKAQDFLTDNFAKLESDLEKEIKQVIDGY